VYLNKFNFKPSFAADEEEKLQEFVDHVASKTHNFTSADLKGLIQNTQLEKMSLKIKEESAKPKKIDADANPGEEEDPDFSIDEQDILSTLA